MTDDAFLWTQDANERPTKRQERQLEAVCIRDRMAVFSIRWLLPVCRQLWRLHRLVSVSVWNEWRQITAAYSAVGDPGKTGQSAAGRRACPRRHRSSDVCRRARPTIRIDGEGALRSHGPAVGRALRCAFVQYGDAQQAAVLGRMPSRNGQIGGPDNLTTERAGDCVGTRHRPWAVNSFTDEVIPHPQTRNWHWTPTGTGHSRIDKGAAVRIGKLCRKKTTRSQHSLECKDPRQNVVFDSWPGSLIFWPKK